MLRTTPPGSGCADITYLPMRRGFVYLVAIMDWHIRKVLPGVSRTRPLPVFAGKHLPVNGRPSSASMH
jgi:hypothetical protein